MLADRRFTVRSWAAQKAQMRVWFPLSVAVIALTLIAAFSGCRAKQEADEVPGAGAEEEPETEKQSD